MNVLMTADTVGGVWTYAMELTRALPDVQFTLATMGRKASEGQRNEVPPNVTLVESEYKLEWQDDPWRDVDAAGEWLLDLESRTNAEVVHLNGYAHAALPFRAPKIVVAHSCVLSWWRAVKDEDAPPEWNTYRERVAQGLRGANVIAAPSAWMLAALDEHYHVPSPRRLIYNGRSFTPATGHGHRAYVFAAGRLWDEAKNLRAVVAAAPSIDWPVRIAGDGGADSPNVTYLGWLEPDALARAYGESAIYLFPALYEPFGLSVLEAALSGCALVLGDIPSLREIWRDAAIFVPPRDPETIARVTNEIIANGEFRHELSQRASKRALEYTVQRMADGYRETYKAAA
ncbi:MAG TPA: glycosyltransferase family 4 protein [Thermoanaerobaculia bacterium]|jgi:glycogen(starch) synthase|nr:glycosyltransferase family 4 protein [Thermoanaerobaculia bacterium]